MSAETNKGSPIPTMPFEAAWNWNVTNFLWTELSSRTLTVQHERPRDKAITAVHDRHHNACFTCHQTKAVSLRRAQRRKFRGSSTKTEGVQCHLELPPLIHQFIHSKLKGPHGLQIDILSAVGIQRYKTSPSQIIKCIQQVTPPHIYLAKP